MWLEQEIPPSCHLRVYLHGPLEVWKREASGGWKLVEKEAWGKGRVARSVFKRLLAAPGRRLSRVTIQDDLWPDSENFELADKNAYNAINQIRQAIGKTLVRTIETSYEIVDQSVVWLDSDTCQALLKEVENRGCTSSQALPLLEQALTILERGELLEGESGTWVYGLRQKSEDMLRQCRLWLAESYEMRGKLWQAGEQYRALLQAVPPDEDALQQWIAMLHRQGKTQEAFKCYQNTKEMWEVQGYSLSETLYGGKTGLLMSQYVTNPASPLPGQTSNQELLKGMIDRSFSKGTTYNLLSSNIKTMNFRDEWQCIVNNLVSETKNALRAMVFDVELTRWWNSIAGQVYMMTNMKLLRKGVSVKRIFILSSFDTRLRMNAIMNAYVHHKVGIDVKICTVTDFQSCIPFAPDMFSVHDNFFVALYYFSSEKPLTNLLLDDKYISEFCAFYDELFMNDGLCTDVESILAHVDYGSSFFTSIKMQLKLLQQFEKIGSSMELARSLWV